jgi:hypothetical protein
MSFGGGWWLAFLETSIEHTTNHSFSPYGTYGTYQLICSLVRTCYNPQERSSLHFKGLHSLVSLHMHQIPMARFGEFYIKFSQLFTTHLLHTTKFTNFFFAVNKLIAKPKRKKLGPSECMLCLSQWSHQNYDP